ncbi:unnamed protein product, partial [Brassica rapa subsp. trilocularis]
NREKFNPKSIRLHQLTRAGVRGSQPNRRYERDEVLVVVHADHPYELFSQPISQAQTISLRNALLGVEETKRRPTMATVERKSVGWKKTGSGDCCADGGNGYYSINMYPRV